MVAGDCIYIIKEYYCASMQAYHTNVSNCINTEIKIYIFCTFYYQLSVCAVYSEQQKKKEEKTLIFFLN